MATCPFQSGPMFDTAGILVQMHYEPCPESASCQLWDANKSECSVKLGGVYNCHMHDSHWHKSEHSASEVPSGLGEPSKSDAPYASVLVNEFVCQQDMDSNGKIYGYDFAIKDSNDKPFVLDSVESNPKWQSPDITVEWNELLTWFKDPESNPDPLS